MTNLSFTVNRKLFNKKIYFFYIYLNTYLRTGKLREYFLTYGLPLTICYYFRAGEPSQR